MPAKELDCACHVADVRFHGSLKADQSITARRPLWSAVSLANEGMTPDRPYRFISLAIQTTKESAIALHTRAIILDSV
jgi:hypothetical protein